VYAHQQPKTLVLHLSTPWTTLKQPLEDLPRHRACLDHPRRIIVYTLRCTALMFATPYSPADRLVSVVVTTTWTPCCLSFLTLTLDSFNVFYIISGGPFWILLLFLKHIISKHKEGFPTITMTAVCSNFKDCQFLLHLLMGKIQKVQFIAEYSLLGIEISHMIS
jgi:hypothetical protein